MIQDRTCQELVGQKPGLAVAWWLMASYAYYVEDDPIITDGQFDKLTKMLIEQPELRKKHRHGVLITDGMLQTGSAAGLKEYPEIVKHAAWARINAR